VDVQDVPQQFLPHINDWTPSKPCAVIWRMGSLVGVEFEEVDRLEV
jgi:hypothetical protein